MRNGVSRVLYACHSPRHKTRRVPSARMRVCHHCQEPFTPAATGRPPKYCSATCRKKAFDQRKLDEAVIAAVARAIAAERRRENRGNETRQSSGNRGNETPAQATLPAPAATPQEQPLVRERAAPPALPPRPRRRSGMTASAMPLPLPGIEGEPDAQPRRDGQG